MLGVVCGLTWRVVVERCIRLLRMWVTRSGMLWGDSTAVGRLGVQRMEEWGGHMDGNGLPLAL